MKLNKEYSSNADKIFVNGVIYSIDDKNSVYESMAIKDGRILALGCNEEVRNYSTDKTEIVDLKFRIMLPGFIDTQCHIPERIMMKKDALSLFEAGNPSQYLTSIQSYVDAHPEEKIIYGVGWKSSDFEGKENDPNRYIEVFKGPNKKWLEKIITDKPIVLKDCNNHTLWLNKEAFEYFKITKNTKPPVGGKIELDEQGELWGTLKENAIRLVNIDNAKNYKDNEYLSRFIKYQNILHSYGITTISLIDEEELEITLELYRRLEITNKLKLKIIYGFTIMPYSVCKKTICEQIHQLKRNRIMYKTDLFDVSIAKFLADGIIEMETAYLFKPYESIGEKYTETNGIFKWDIVEFKEAITMANRLDFNVFIHAVGDFACKLAIDAIDDSANNMKHSYRNSLIHIDLITKYYIRRMKLLNINAIIQPFWFYKNVNSSKNEVLVIGKQRAHREYPVKSLIDQGIVTAGASDHGVTEESSPLNAIECAIIRNLYDFIPSRYPEKVDLNDTRYRLNPSERISVIEAIKVFTINAAYVLGKEKEIGSLEIGKKADFIVLDKNIFTTEPLDIHDINVVQTYFNGDLVYLNE
ncbi:exoenzyme regulatory protein aepA precursor [Clostridium gelidum]|uniref:Exoenzyme regulatory protein aepA n=1 Tax=Clostridium gelidum TaxID=704125 RepID=A0ABM7T837_9CLOT|nr:amidohydrolase family protein [Clostridium gelidum]BCZ45097.1 exoenzyme regulatory protein aepA precursor [Clostridium gelidum]